MKTKSLRRIALFLLVYSIMVSCVKYCPTRCANGVCTPLPCETRVVIVNVGHK